MGKKALLASSLIVFSAIVLSFSIFFFQNDDLASAAFETKFIDRVGAGFMAPACGSSSAPAECVGSGDLVVNLSWAQELDLAQCENGMDDDDDGRIDYPADRLCASPDDNDEDTEGLGGPALECQNVFDDDDDDGTDYPGDWQCVSLADPSEGGPEACREARIVITTTSGATVHDVSGIPCPQGQGSYQWTGASYGTSYNYTVTGYAEEGMTGKTVDSLGNVGAYTSIAASGSNIYISYYDNTLGKKDLKFAKSTDGGVNWTTTLVATNAANLGMYNSIAVSGSKIYISYFDATSNNLNFIKSTDGGDTWPISNIRLVDAPGDVGRYSSIAVSGSNIYISYYDNSLSKKDLKLAKSSDDGNTWLPADIKIVDSTGNVGQYSSIEADGSNVYISYRDVTNTNLKFAKSTDGGATWPPSNIKTVNFGDTGAYSSIAVSGSNIYISYRIAFWNNLKFAKSTDGGATWLPADIKIVDAPGNIGVYTSIAVSGSNIYISYRDNTNLNLKFAKSTDGGATWNTKTIDSLGNTGNYTSIAAPDANNIYISYRDSTNGDLKFVKSNDGGATWTLFPSGGHEIATGSFSTPVCSAALPTVSVSATDSTASEPGTDTGAITFTRTGSTASSLTVNYTISGTATNGTDYTSIASPITIPAGQASAVLTITPINDATVEPSETATLTISANAAYTVGAPNSATVNINDDDGKAVSLNATPLSLVRNTGNFTVNWNFTSGYYFFDSLNDWIGMYLVGSTDDSYIDSKQTFGGSSGNVSFSSNRTPGNYEFRYFDTIFGYVGNRLGASNQVEITAPGAPTVKMTAIVCPQESDLPNWNNQEPITSGKISDFLNNNPTCTKAAGWSFQWGKEFGTIDPWAPSTLDPGGSFIGEAGPPWVTFGPTDASGITETTLDADSILLETGNSAVWFREVLQPGYLPFSASNGDPNPPLGSVSAEFWCSTDVEHYDNYELVPLHNGQTYYCVVFNVLAFPTFNLSVNSSGASSVSISSATGHGGTTNYNKPGLSSGTSVTLTAPLVSGYNWNGWTGGGCSGVSLSCTVTMNANIVVRANYTMLPPPDYTLNAYPPIFVTIKGSSPIESTKTTITALSLNGYSGNERLDVVSGAPAGSTHNFIPVNRRINIPADGSVSAQYSITIPPTTTSGAYNIRIQGTGGSNPSTIVTLNVEVKDPGFEEVMSPIFEVFAKIRLPIVEAFNPTY